MQRYFSCGSTVRIAINHFIKLFHFLQRMDEFIIKRPLSSLFCTGFRFIDSELAFLYIIKLVSQLCVLQSG